MKRLLQPCTQVNNVHNLMLEFSAPPFSVTVTSYETTQHRIHDNAKKLIFNRKHSPFFNNLYNKLL